MTAMETPIFDPHVGKGDYVRIPYCDDDGLTRFVTAQVAFDHVVQGDFIAILARREVFDLIGHTDCPEFAGQRGDLPQGYDLGLVLIDECEANRRLRLVVDNTKDI